MIEQLLTHTFTDKDVLVISVPEQQLKEPGVYEMMRKQCDEMAERMREHFGFTVPVFIKADTMSFEVFQAGCIDEEPNHYVREYPEDVAMIAKLLGAGTSISQQNWAADRWELFSSELAAQWLIVDRNMLGMFARYMREKGYPLLAIKIEQGIPEEYHRGPKDD